MSDTLAAISRSTSCCDKTTCCGDSHESADIKEVVREKYGEAATRAASGAKSSCCDTSTCCGGVHP